MIGRSVKRELKAALIQALMGKLPLIVGGYRLESAQTSTGQDPFLNIKVKDLNGNLETYLEVSVKEAL